MFKHTALIFAHVFLLSCGDKKAPLEAHSGVPTFGTLGFYVNTDDGLYYDGGYNNSRAGLRFQFIVQKSDDASGLNLSTMCGRLLTDRDERLVGAGGCTALWGEARSVASAKGLFEYQEAAIDFSRYLKSTVPPAGYVEVWEELSFYLERFSQAPLLEPSTPGQVAGQPQMSPEEVAIAEGQYKRSSQLFREEFQTYYVEPHERKMNLENFEFGADAENTTSVYALEPGQFPAKKPGKNVRLAEWRSWPGFEFRQQVEIWAQKFEIFGIATGSEHSSVYALVQKRARHSSGPWEYETEWYTFNHGARPGLDRMRIKRTCLAEQMPITPNYCIIQGECDGEYDWYHVCNDDTAYQIRSAHGVWTDTNDQGEGACRGRRRYNPSTCSMPW